MSFIERVREANDAELDDFVPFEIGAWRAGALALSEPEVTSVTIAIHCLKVLANC